MAMESTAWLLEYLFRPLRDYTRLFHLILSWNRRRFTKNVNSNTECDIPQF